MTGRWEEMRRVAEELKRITRESPCIVIVARQPEPLHRSMPPERPPILIVDGLGLLR